MILTFYYGNNGSISTDFNIKDYSKKTIYYSNLKHADNSVSLSIPYSEQIQNILNANADENIKAEITDGTKYIFSGYLRKDFSFGKKQRNQPISLEIVSPSYLLDVDSTTVHSERNKSLAAIVTYLLSAAGFSGTYDLSIISGITVPLFIINEGDNIRSVLDQILFEYGFQYDFSDAGFFSVYPIFSDVPADKTTISQTFDGSNCIDEIKISKKEQQYNGTKVSYEPVSLKNDVIVFADTTNGDANGLTCNIELPAHSYLGDLTDETTTYYIDYDSTEGEVKWAETVSLIVESTNNNGLTKTFTNHGTRGEISIYNSTNAAITITKIQVKGSAYVSKETAISVSSNGRKFYEYSAKYLQSAPQADTLASNYTNWQNYADYTMDVKSSDDFVLGSFVKVEEVGLATMYGRIVEKTERLDGKPIQYKIEAISDYAPSSATTTVRQKAIFTTIGLKGDKGDTGEQGPQGPQGETGGQGAKGDTGVSMRNKGNWESGIAYVNNSSYIDVVYYAANGCSYACKKSHTSANAILPTNTTYWSLLAEKGDTGEQGPQGEQGEPGANGTSPTVTSTTTQYKQTSTNTQPTSGWGSMPSTLTAGYYLWSKTTITYSDGATAVSYSSTRNGSNGTNGSNAVTYEIDCPMVYKAGNTVTFTFYRVETGARVSATVYARWYYSSDDTTWTEGTGSKVTAASLTTTAINTSTKVKCEIYTDSSATTPLDVEYSNLVTDGTNGTNGTNGVRGSVWYTGNKITGTSTTATIFSGSGITDAKVGDMYKNTDTSYTYQCTVAGNASTAKWKYVGSIKGSAGSNGTSYYTYFRYSANSDGTDFVTAPTSSTKYIGVYSGTSSTAPTDKTSYTWSKYVGNDGSNGTSLTSKGNWAANTAYKVNDIVYVSAQRKSYVCKTAHTSGSTFATTNWNVLTSDGTNGSSATQYYMHFVYCDDTTSGTNYSTTESRKYIGVYTDTTQADASDFDTAKVKSGIVWSQAEGDEGQRGTGTYKTTTAPTTYTTTTGGFTPAYRISKSTVLSEAGVSEVLVGDVIENSYYHYPVGYVASDYVYLGFRVSIRGATGANGTNVYIGNENITLACDKDGKLKAALSTTVKVGSYVGASRVASTITSNSNSSNVVVGTITNGTTSADGSVPLTLAASEAVTAGELVLKVVANSITFYKTVTISVAKDGTNGTNGTSPWTVSCSEPSVGVACGTGRTANAAQTVTVKFNAFQGTTRKAATIAVGTLPSGVTATTNTAATTSADGTLVLTIASGANLGGTTAAYDNVEILLTVTANSVAYTFAVHLSKSIKGSTGTRGTLTFSGTEIGDIRASAVAYTLTTASTGITSNSMSILVGDRYIHSLTGDVWKCTTAGTASTAKWTYDGRQAKDSDSSNQWRFFGEGTKTKYNAGGTNISQTEVTGEGPFGGNTSLLKITRPANAASNGRVCPYSKTIKLEAGVSYRYVCYAKKTNNGYINYFGCRGWEQQSETSKNSQILNLSGTEVNSGYFCSSDNFGTVGRWYLVIGYVTAHGVTTAPANDAGVYDMVTKQKVATCNNYQFKNITEFGHTGTLIEYSANSVTPTAENTTYIYDIRFDKMDGTQPTLNELLNLDTDVKSKGAWASGTVYYIGDIVSYTNGNSYICKANHTASSSILPTNTTYWDLVASKGDRGYSSRTIAFRVNYSAFSTTNNGEVYTCGYNSSGAEADTYGYVIVNGTTYYAKGMTNTNIACDGYLVIPTTSTSSGSPSVPVVAYENGNNNWYYIQNGKTAEADYTVAIAAADKSKWVVLAKVRQSTGEDEITLEPMTACLLSSINQPINYYYEGIVAAVTQYTSASITPYKITQSSGTFSKTAITARYAKRGAVVLNTNAVTPTSSTAAVKFQFYNGTYWNEVASTDARYSKFISLVAGDLPGLAGYYTTLNLAVPTICGTYIDTLTSNKAFIGQLFANSISVGNTIQSSNYAATSSSSAGAGFKLSSNGTADLNQITINGMRLSHDINNNLALGRNALSSSGLSGSYNVGIGPEALYKNTTGSYNIGIGTQPLYKNTTGSHNTAIGYLTLDRNTTGIYNVGIGSVALYNNTAGSNNIGIGYHALYNITSGDDNIAIGPRALESRSSNGDGDLAIGYRAMSHITETRGWNTAIGTFSGGDQTTTITKYGAANLFVGYDCGGIEGWDHCMNINKTLIYLEFPASCTSGKAFASIMRFKTLYNNVDIPCMGVVGNPKSGENRAIACAKCNSSTSIQLKNVNETVYKTFTRDSSATLGEEVFLCFMCRQIASEYNV